MSDTIRFSVIVPFFLDKEAGRAEFMAELSGTIPSRPDLEILWIDDHSLARWAPPGHPGARLVKNHPDWRFAGTARNRGLDLARGDWVIFADSDDRFDTAALEEILDAILETPEAADLWLFPSTSFIDGSNAPGVRHLYGNRALEAARLSQDPARLVHYCVPYGRVIRKSWLEEKAIRFGATRVVNDALFAVDLALSAPRVRYWPRPAYAIRQGHASTITNMSEPFVRDRFTVWRGINERLDAAGRADLKDPLLFRVLKTLRANPSVTLQETWHSARAGHAILPSIPRAMRSLKHRVSDLFARFARPPSKEDTP